ncbi:MAG: site-specific integrase [Pseudomonadota bacterium]
MLNAQINEELSGQFASFGLSPLPAEVIDRDGRQMDVSGDVWKFNIPYEVYTHDWSTMRIAHPVLAYAMKRYVIHVAMLNSPKEASNTVSDFAGLFTGKTFERTKDAAGSRNGVREQWEALQRIEDLDALSEGLFALTGRIAKALRSRNVLYRLHRLRAWFSWAADILPELGFSEEYALELNRIYVPGNVKGRAVEIEDDEGGPLSEEEVRALRIALDQDKASERQHVMQRAAVGLGLAFGRNPANYVLLREMDFWDELECVTAQEAEIQVEPEWRLNIPRIKKRGVAARGQMQTEYVDRRVARYICDLIETNKYIDTGKRPRALFMREEADDRRAGTGVDEFSFHLTVADFRYLVGAFAKRLGVVSPRTGMPLKLTPRRLRYTFATIMVELGVSPKALARMLDHSDTQHVQVYFALKGLRLTRHLDKAAALKLAGFFQLFKGKIVDSDLEALNGDDPTKKMYFTATEDPSRATKVGVCGKKPLCLLDPPFSCYLCALFQPYREADHEGVLDTLLTEREARMARYGDRLGVQLDDVIIAVSNVIDKIDVLKEVVLNG